MVKDEKKQVLTSNIGKQNIFLKKSKSYFTQFILQKCNLKGNEV